MGASRKLALCEELTAALNALGPAVKTVKLWRKYWSWWLCCDSRKQAREIKRERRRTGGGRLGGVEGLVLAILDVTVPDCQPVRVFTGDEVRIIIVAKCLEVVGRLSNDCGRQLRILEETQAEAREPAVDSSPTRGASASSSVFGEQRVVGAGSGN
ncbi:hypothetical protein HPB52_013455 [Rhipicephalus sanguineus]|uniref:Uncharacterized protein n=1 Tax=Rhipicephalus sanguineus TaxID=34632 RepID=A0A9D4PFK0_RHISA|nr:hypothetical protein HPB52_013455 [Rhipicephalus sanguineus]